MTPPVGLPFRRRATVFGLVIGLSAPAAADVAPGAPTPIEVAVAHADPDQGHAIASAQCGICHSFAAGGPSLIGPNLYGVVGRPIASFSGYSYSSALKAKAGVWTDAALDGWLAAPSNWAPGSRMGYAGLGNPGQRADVIAYLHELKPKIPSK